MMFCDIVTFSNTIVFFGIKSGIFDMRPESRLLPFLIQAGIISILTGTLLSLILSRFPMRSIHKLISAIHRVAEGNFDTKIDLKPLSQKAAASPNCPPRC